MLMPCGCVCGTSDSCACVAVLNEESTISNFFIGSPDRILFGHEIRAVGKGRSHLDVRNHLGLALDDLCDRMRLLDRTACRPIRDIRARELERPPAVVAASGVELRSMVREC